jgi:hypothetical protein
MLGDDVMASRALAYRGRVIGVLLILLGIWRGFLPFVGPYFDFAYTPDRAWAYNSGRLWLSIAPALAVFLGGLLIVASDRAAAFGSFLAVLGGIWFVIGPLVVAFVLPGHGITPGSPAPGHGALFGPTTMRFLEQLGFFYGVGVVIVFFAAVALGEVVVARLAARRYAQWIDADLERTQQYGSVY